MANARKNSIGKSLKGKGAGVGAMTTLPEGALEENMTLSNRDKSRRAGERGLDSRATRTEQSQDDAGNRRSDDEQAQ